MTVYLAINVKKNLNNYAICITNNYEIIVFSRQDSTVIYSTLN